MNEQVTIVVCTCDAYEDAWMPLFTLFAKYWKGLNYKIVLNTETKSFQFPGLNIVSPQLYKNVKDYEKIPWSKRLKEVLKSNVDTELVLIYLDDFYLESEVNQTKLDICINLMGKNPRIGNIQLFPCPPGYTVLDELPWLVKRKKGTPYYFNLQAGLWRTSRLIHFLRDHESPWYFERWGSKRAMRYSDEVYCINPEAKDNMVFRYSPSMIGLSKGLWLPKTKDFFEKEGINLDTQIRGNLSIGYKFPAKKRDYLRSFIQIAKSLVP